MPSPSEQAEQDRADQLAQRKAAEEAGNVQQVSSAALHNYPDASIKLPEEQEEQPTYLQPLTGAAATAVEHPGVPSQEGQSASQEGQSASEQGQESPQDEPEPQAYHPPTE